MDSEDAARRKRPINNIEELAAALGQKSQHDIGAYVQDNLVEDVGDIIASRMVNNDGTEDLVLEVPDIHLGFGVSFPTDLDHFYEVMDEIDEAVEEYWETH